MDDRIRHYADALYERSLQESATILRDERIRLFQDIATRRSVAALPPSGLEVQAILRLFVQHVERCMKARLESYRKAYDEAKQILTDEEFSEILTSVQNTHTLQVENSARALREIVKQQGTDFDTTDALVASSAYGHDRLLAEWKVWREQVRLTKAFVANDQRFARMAFEEAKCSVAEDDRVHPKVGVLIVKDGEILSKAHRGESPKGHAEFIALEKKMSEAAGTGATVYTTLEPCTTRNHPKIPCVERLIERRVARVVIGMLDPDPRITGRGQRRLREARIVVDSFPWDIADEVEELNREFTRHRKGSESTATMTAAKALDLERFLVLEELAGQVVEELASHRALDRSVVGPMLEEYRQAAGRFARYNDVRRAILQLQNTLERMFAAKRDHSDDEGELRWELDRDLKRLLVVCDETERDKLHRGACGPTDAP